MLASLWEGEPGLDGELVAVRKHGEQEWFYFRVRRDGTHHYLEELKPGQVRGLAGHGGAVIPYKYPGVLRVIPEDRIKNEVEISFE